MSQLFLGFLNRSIQASLLVVVVILMRYLLKKTPKWIHCLMWGMVAIRLICPFSLESAFSLAPEAEVVQTDISEGRTQIQSGIPAIDRPANAYLESHYTVKSATSIRAQAFHPQSLIAVIWIVGIIALASYAAHSYRKLRKRVQESALLQGNTYLCDRIQTPFILGVIKPHIYLPSNLTDEQQSSVLAHEQAHLKRGDHLWKPLGYLLLAFYWFNPFCWIAYILLCRDIEMACDEKVIRDMDLEEKKVYSRVILSFSTPGKMISACPLAFGEVGVKQRIRAVLNYKKPAFWVIVLAAVAILVTAVCFMTNPLSKEGDANTIQLTNESSIGKAEAQSGGRTEEISKKESEFDVLSQVVSNIGLENAYPWNNTVEFKENADVLIKMASDETGEYEVYGIMSERYGTYGLVLNDKKDGEDNWNFVYEPWFYTGAPDDTPVLQKSADGEYTFSYVYDVKDGAAWWKDGIIYCGYDTGHMELQIMKQYNKENSDQTDKKTYQDSKNLDGTPSRAYVEALQDKISADMASGKLPYFGAAR